MQNQYLQHRWFLEYVYGTSVKFEIRGNSYIGRHFQWFEFDYTGKHTYEVIDSCTKKHRLDRNRIHGWGRDDGHPIRDVTVVEFRLGNPIWLNGKIHVHITTGVEPIKQRWFTLHMLNCFEETYKRVYIFCRSSSLRWHSSGICNWNYSYWTTNPDSKVHVAHMGPSWGR